MPQDIEMDFDSIPPSKPPNDEDAARARHAYDWFEAVFGTQAMTGWPSADAFKQARRCKVKAVESVG